MILDNFDRNVWQDSSIEKITISYNDIVLELETDTGIRKIVFENYIAFDYLAQWDENIVEAIYEDKNNEIIGYALKKVNELNNTELRGGGKRDIHSDWTCVIIKLIDNVCIRIVCDNVILELQ